MVDKTTVPTNVREALTTLVEAVWVVPSNDTIVLSHAFRTLVDAELLVSAHAPLRGALLECIPKLRALFLTTTDTSYVDLEYCHARGIVVSNTRHYTGTSVAEHAFTLMLSSLRQIIPLDRAARIGELTGEMLGTEIAGKIAGVVGLGGIGSSISGLAAGFGMQVVFCNRSEKRTSIAQQVSLRELMATSDVIFLTLPLTSVTRHMINDTTISLMKRSAVLVNVSADELVDLNSVRKALEDNRLKAFGADIMGDPAPYCSLPRTIITHRRAWYTAECLERRAKAWCASISDYLSGTQTNLVIE